MTYEVSMTVPNFIFDKEKAGWKLVTAGITKVPRDGSPSIDSIGDVIESLHLESVFVPGVTKESFKDERSITALASQARQRGANLLGQKWAEYLFLNQELWAGVVSGEIQIAFPGTIWQEPPGRRSQTTMARLRMPYLDFRNGRWALCFGAPTRPASVRFLRHRGERQTTRKKRRSHDAN